MKRLPLLLAMILTLALVIAACGTPVPSASLVAAAGTPTTETGTTAAATAPATAQAFTGYLIDQKCGLSGVDVQDGSDLTKYADKHQLSCAMMPGCIASGFGLSIQQSDGTYKFYSFDAAGSQTAIDSIINKTTRTDHLLVDVTGTMSGDTITLGTIVEK